MIPPVKTALYYAMATVKGFRNVRLYSTKTSGCPCVLFEHNDMTYSIVYFVKWRTYTIFSNFGTPGNKREASRINKFELARVIKEVTDEVPTV